MLGAIYSIAVALSQQQGLPTAGILSILSGLLFCCVGLIADQISQLRLLQLSQIRAEYLSNLVSKEPADSDC